MVETRQIVVPGEVVDDSGDLRPGMNTYQEGRAIYALRLGVKTVRGDHVSVISLSGRYEPMRGDMVIGTVAEVGPSNWYINIGSANDVGMHVNDVPWRVEFGETSKYMAVGDTVLLKIVHVDEMKKAQVSMKDRQCRKLTGGLIFEVNPTKVPRIVGRNGSMIGLIKDATHVRIFVGQNGVIWVDGEADDVQLALEALRKIEAEAHTTGLTDRMKAWLEERRPLESRPKRAQPAEDEPLVSETPQEERPPRRERPERREERGDRGDRPPRREERGDRPHRSRDERSRQFRGDEDAEPAPREERPARRFEGEERPARRFEGEERPARRPEGDERPARRFEREERPTRRFEGEERPARRAPDEDRPARTSEREARGPARRFADEDEDRPRRRFEDEAASAPPARPRRFQDDDDDAPAPARRPASDDDDNDDRPMRAPREGGSDRPFGGSSAGGDGGRRRRRGGRGRGRGRKED